MSNAQDGGEELEPRESGEPGGPGGPGGPQDRSRDGAEAGGAEAGGGAGEDAGAEEEDNGMDELGEPNEENWNFYACELDSKFTVITLGMHLAGEGPKESHPHLLMMRIPLTDPEGLPDKEEADALNSLEDALLPELERQLDAVYVGRLTTAGRRELFFYAPSAEGWPDAVEEAFSDFPQYEPEFAEQRDPDWDFYFGFLYPEPRQVQQMLNRDVLENLAKAGDDPDKPRPVDHTIEFPTEEARSAFLKVAVERGFIETEEDQEDCGDGCGHDHGHSHHHEHDASHEHAHEHGHSHEHGHAEAGGEGHAEAGGEEDEGGEEGDEEPEMPFRLTITRDETTDPENIDAVVDELFVLAEEHGGRYDGWGALVMPKGDSAPEAEAEGGETGTPGGSEGK
jgi:uncharacterized protein (TIGR01619 family)